METAELAVSTSSHLSIFGLFLAADLLVKSVMILLVTASIWSWSIMIQKTRSFRNQRNLTHFFEESFWSQDSLDDFYDQLGKLWAFCCCSHSFYARLLFVPRGENSIQGSGCLRSWPSQRYPYLVPLCLRGVFVWKYLNFHFQRFLR